MVRFHASHHWQETYDLLASVGLLHNGQLAVSQQSQRRKRRRRKVSSVVSSGLSSGSSGSPSYNDLFHDLVACCFAYDIPTLFLRASTTFIALLFASMPLSRRCTYTSVFLCSVYTVLLLGSRALHLLLDYYNVAFFEMLSIELSYHAIVAPRV